MAPLDPVAIELFVKFFYALTGFFLVEGFVTLFMIGFYFPTIFAFLIADWVLFRVIIFNNDIPR